MSALSLNSSIFTPSLARATAMVCLLISLAVNSEELKGTLVTEDPQASLETTPPDVSLDPISSDAPVAAEDQMPIFTPPAVRQLVHEIKQGLDEAHENDDFEEGILIPLFALALLFGGPLGLVALFLIFHYRAKARREKIINDHIDKLLAAGRDIPIELLRADEAKIASDQNSLNKGVKNTCKGVGLLIFLTLFLGIKIGAIGFIWIAYGISEIIVWKLSRTDKVQQIEAQD